MVTLEQSERNRKTRLLQAYDRAPKSLFVHQVSRRCDTQVANFEESSETGECDDGFSYLDLPPLWRARLGDTPEGRISERSEYNRERLMEYAHRLMVSLDSEAVL